ncbi:MAG TPA: oligosaccharide flippase family protein [Candidatus Kapabacteria bacterium]|nr:oligosaccharide flippase family protein [Candidatus Kapabacteria bacterium]
MPTTEDKGVLSSFAPQEASLAPSVGSRAVRGAALLTGATYISMLLGIAARKALALLLTPEQVGLYQAALSFVDLVVSFAAFSFTSAIINVRDNLVTEPLPNLKENVFVLTVVVHGLFAVLAMALGLFLLPKTHGVILAALVGMYAVQRFMSSLDTFYTQILERELSYSKVSRVTLIVNIILHTSSVAFALLGGGAWAIPIATILSTVIGYMLDRHYVHKSGLPILRKHPWKYYDRGTTRWLWKFGTKVLFNRVFESWLFKIDNVLVAYLFGSFYLGYYAQAFSIALLPATAVAPIVARVSIATYAEVQHDRTILERAFAITNFFLVRLMIPATIFIAFESKDIVRVFLSSNWGGVAEPLTALAGMVLTVPLFENAKMILGATLKLVEISVIRGLQLLTLVILIATFQWGGILYIALAVSFVNVAGYAGMLIYMKRIVNPRWNENFVLPLVIGAIVALLVGFVLEPALANALPAAIGIETPIVRILLFGIVILAACLLAEYPFHKTLYRERLAEVASKLRRR